MPYDGLHLGHYRLLHLISDVGRGKVYLAEDIHTQRQVAIKIFQSEGSLYSDTNAAEEAAQLFQHEIKAIDMLDHPHILPFFDLHEENINGIISTYLVMPFRKEGSLSNWLKQRGSPEMLTPEDVAYFIYQAADALQYAHNHHVIHQSVKPSRFLIRSKEGDPNRPDLLLTGFRMSKFSFTNVSANVSIDDTPTYMAPEQWNGQPVPATDQYALAVMAYQLLTGFAPFQGTSEELKYQHFNAKPLSPSVHNMHIPVALDKVILRALEKKPDNRFSSLLVFAEAFQEALSVKPESRQPTAPARRFDVTQPQYEVSINTPLPPPIDTRVGSSSQVLIKSRSLTKRTVALLIGLFIVLAGGSLGYLSTIMSSQLTKHNTLANAQVNITKPTILLSYPFSNRLLLNDPLSDNRKGNKWEEDSQRTGHCAYQESAYHVAVSNQGHFHSCFALASNFSNFTYEVQMTISKGDCGGIIFRRKGPEFYYFRICEDGSYFFVRYVEDSGSSFNKQLISGTASAINTGLNVSNVIAVVASGSKLDLYVNRQLISSVSDNTYIQGQIGLVAKDILHPTEAVFTNVKVWIL